GYAKEAEPSDGPKVKKLIHFQEPDHRSCMALSPDGKALAVGSSRETAIRIIDAATGKELHNLAGHTGGVSYLSFLPAGKSLVSGGGDSVVRLWDAANGKKLREFKGLERGVSGLAVSPDGKTLAAAEGGHICVWEVSNGE